MEKEIIKIGSVGMYREEAEQIEREGKYVCTYSRIYKIKRRKNGEMYGSVVLYSPRFMRRNRWWSYDEDFIYRVVFRKPNWDHAFDAFSHQVGIGEKYAKKFDKAWNNNPFFRRWVMEFSAAINRPFVGPFEDGAVYLTFLEMAKGGEEWNV